MNHRGKTSAFVMGLIAGILNIFLGIFAALYVVTALAGFSYTGYMNNFILYILIFFVIAVANLIGGAVVLGSRIAGGVLMILTGLPLLILFIYGAINYYAIYFFIPNESAAIAFLAVFIITELISVIAAIIAFSGPKRFAYPYGQYYLGHGQFPYQPYPGYGQQPPYQGFGQPPYQSVGQQPYQAYGQPPQDYAQQAPQAFSQQPVSEDRPPEPKPEQPQQTIVSDDSNGVTPEM